MAAAAGVLPLHVGQAGREREVPLGAVDGLRREERDQLHAGDLLTVGIALRIGALQSGDVPQCRYSIAGERREGHHLDDITGAWRQQH